MYTEIYPVVKLLLSFVGIINLIQYLLGVTVFFLQHTLRARVDGRAQTCPVRAPPRYTY